MDQRTEELRRDMEHRRSAIGETVDEIENRVNPSHVVARRTHRMRTRMTQWKDSIMGETHDGGEIRERAAGMADSVREAPEMVERRTKGNPLAVGLIAVGAGAVVAALLPETRQERRLARRMEPKLERAASEVGETAREVAHDAKESAGEGLSRVKESARSSGEDLKEETRRAGERVGGS